MRAMLLFRSAEVREVTGAVADRAHDGTISLRRDRVLHADVGLSGALVDLVLCYEPRWLVLGLETVFGEIVPMPPVAAAAAASSSSSSSLAKSGGRVGRALRTFVAEVRLVLVLFAGTKPPCFCGSGGLVGLAGVVHHGGVQCDWLLPRLLCWHARSSGCWQARHSRRQQRRLTCVAGRALRSSSAAWAKFRSRHTYTPVWYACPQQRPLVPHVSWHVECTCNFV